MREAIEQRPHVSAAFSLNRRASPPSRRMGVFTAFSSAAFAANTVAFFFARVMPV